MPADNDTDNDNENNNENENDNQDTAIDARLSAELRRRVPEVSEDGVWDQINAVAEKSMTKQADRPTISPRVLSVAAAALITLGGAGFLATRGTTNEAIEATGSDQTDVEESGQGEEGESNQDPTSEKEGPAPVDQNNGSDQATSADTSPAEPSAVAIEPWSGVINQGEWIAVLETTTDAVPFQQIQARASQMALQLELTKPYIDENSDTSDSETPELQSEIGVLSSEHYPSFRDGFYLLHLSGFKSDKAANDACAALAPTKPDCYVALIDEQPAPMVGIEFNTALIVDRSFHLKVVSLKTGQELRTVTEYWSFDGKFSDTASIAGSKAYHSPSNEDQWYTCDSSHQEVEEVDLLTGEVETIRFGQDPMVSPDTSKLVLSSQSECIIDPTDLFGNPTAGVDTGLEFYSSSTNQLVIRDLEAATDQTFQMFDPTPGETIESPTWHPDGDRVFFIRGSTNFDGPRQSSLWELSLVDGTTREISSQPNLYRIVGFDANNDHVVVRLVEGTTIVNEYLAIDPETGETSPLETDPRYPWRIFDPTGKAEIQFGNGREILVSGSELTLAPQLDNETDGEFVNYQRSFWSL